MENKMNTVQSLRQNGYQVRVRHLRDMYVQRYGEGNIKALDDKNVTLTFEGMLEYCPTGGKTEVEITTPDGRTLTGVATASRKDHYNKKIGTQIAIGRALKGL